MHSRIRSLAIEATEHGYDVILLKPGQKTPAFRGWQERLMDQEELQWRLRQEGYNYGILVRGLCVLDKDARRARGVTDLLAAHDVRSPMEILSPGGNHIYTALPDTVKEVRTRIKFLDLPLDVKMTGYMVGRGSVLKDNGFVYRLKSRKRLMPKAELPLLPAGIVELLNADHPSGSPELPVKRFPRRGEVKNPEAYVLRVESHMGANGSAGLVRAVCVLRDAGKSAQETYEFLTSVWNQPPRVTPTWSAAEIEYAVRRHFK